MKNLLSDGSGYDLGRDIHMNTVAEKFKKLEQARFSGTVRSNQNLQCVKMSGKIPKGTVTLNSYRLDF